MWTPWRVNAPSVAYSTYKNSRDSFAVYNDDVMWSLTLLLLFSGLGAAQLSHVPEPLVRRPAARAGWSWRWRSSGNWSSSNRHWREIGSWRRRNNRWNRIISFPTSFYRPYFRDPTATQMRLDGPRHARQPPLLLQVRLFSDSLFGGFQNEISRNWWYSMLRTYVICMCS